MLAASPLATSPRFPSVGTFRVDSFDAPRSPTDGSASPTSPTAQALFPGATDSLVILRSVNEGLRASVSLAAGAKLPLGTRSANAEYFVIKGAVVLSNPRTREERTAKAGSHLLISAHCPHSIVALEDSQLLFVSPSDNPTFKRAVVRDGEVE
ncbi:hypothetical protein HK105_201461 [Polyrhizophydium stewartii]|uniref:Cupin type-1 domain-containing protein n=1 Tax=Polyrhizophydium stewartii TaxID=2732419 RepID=A0ABR4NIA0_9FUNG